MALWVCSACTAAYSVGAPHCPQCGSTAREGDPGAEPAPVPEPDVDTDAGQLDDDTEEDEADG